MKKYNPKIHNRKSIRLKGYDYAQVGLYFITLSVQDRVALFGDIVDGIMYHNRFGTIVSQEWENTAEIRKNCSLGAYIVMPNHFHAIISIDIAVKESNEKSTFKSPSQTIGAIIRGYKGATTKKIKEIIRSQGEGKGEGKGKGELQFAPTAPTDIDLSSIDLSRSIWQRDYYEHIIRTEQAYTNIENYIINNPSKWSEDKLHH